MNSIKLIEKKDLKEIKDEVLYRVNRETVYLYIMQIEVSLNAGAGRQVNFGHHTLIFLAVVRSFKRSRSLEKKSFSSGVTGVCLALINIDAISCSRSFFRFS